MNVLARLIIVLSLVGVAGPAAAQSAALPDKDGWWNRFVGPQDGEPSNPVRPVVPVVPAAPTVPSDAIAVGTTGGQQDKLAAVGIRADAPLATLTMSLKESTAGGANSSAAQATVYACPITGFWSDGQRNGRWADRPRAECGLTRVDGRRAADGTWTFVLTPIAHLWAAGLAQNGVLLAVDASSGPGAFQVSFVDAARGGVRLSATKAPAPGTAPTAPAADPPVQVQESQAPPVVGDATTAAPLTPPPLPEIVLARPAVTQTAGGGPRQGDVLGNLPAGLIVFVPLLFAMGLVISYVLGPAGIPEPDARRHGSISRVLAAMRQNTEE